MSFLTKHADGTIHEVTDSRLITREELVADVEQKKVELVEAEKRVAQFDIISSPVVEEATTVEATPEVPAEVAPENLTELPAAVVVTPTVETVTVTEQPVAPVAEPIQPVSIPIQ